MQGVRSVQVYAVTIALAGLRLGGLALAARILGVTSVGAVAFGLAFAGIIAFVNNLGLDTAHVQVRAHAADPAAARGAYLALRLASTATYAGIALLVAHVWLAPTLATSALVVVHIAIMFEATRTVTSSIAICFQADERFGNQQLVNSLDTLGRVFILALVAFAAEGAFEVELMAAFAPSGAQGADAVLLALAYAAGGLAAMGVATWLLVTRCKVALPDVALLRAHLVVGVPAIGFLAVTALEANVDSLMLERLWGTAEVGVYFAAQRLAFIVQLLPVVLYNVTFPRLSQLTARKDLLGRNLLVQNTARRALSLIAVGVPVAVLIAPIVVRVLYGPDFTASARLVPVLVLASLASAYTMLHFTSTLAAGRPGRTSLAGAIALAFNLGLNGLLIPQSGAGLGAMGAAIATAASTFAAGVALSLLAGPGRPAHLDIICLKVMATTLPIALLAVAILHLPWAPWMVVGLAVPLSVAHVALLYFARVISGTDLRWAMRSARDAVRFS